MESTPPSLRGSLYALMFSKWGLVDVAGITIGVVVDELKSRLAGEELLDDLGLPQSDRISFDELEKFHTSVLDTFEVLATYLRILEIAKHQHNERNNE